MATTSRSESLFSIEERLASIFDELTELLPENDEAEMSEEDALRQDELMEQLREASTRESAKIDAIGDVLARFAKIADENRRESDRLSARAELFDRRRLRLSQYVIQLLDFMGVTKLEGTRRTLTKRKNPDSLFVDPAKVSKLPPEYQRVTVKIVARAKEVERAMKLRDEFEVATVTVEPDKVELKRRVAMIEKGVEDGPAPDGVEIRTGDYRLEAK